MIPHGLNHRAGAEVAGGHPNSAAQCMQHRAGDGVLSDRPVKCAGLPAQSGMHNLAFTLALPVDHDGNPPYSHELTGRT